MSHLTSPLKHEIGDWCRLWVWYLARSITAHLSGPLPFTQFTFSEATAFNQPLNSWDVSRVTSLRVRGNKHRFLGTCASPSKLHATRVSCGDGFYTLTILCLLRSRLLCVCLCVSVFATCMFNHRMFCPSALQATFSSASVFNQPLNSWDVSRVTTLEVRCFTPVFHNRCFTPVTPSQPSCLASLYRMRLRWRLISRVLMSLVCTLNMEVRDTIASNIRVRMCYHVLQMTFYNASAFNHSVDSWDVSRVTTLEVRYNCHSIFSAVWGVTVPQALNVERALAQSCLSSVAHSHTP